MIGKGHMIRGRKKDGGTPCLSLLRNVPPEALTSHQMLKDLVEHLFKPAPPHPFHGSADNVMRNAIFYY
jgi:hypothetical protein